MLRFWKDKLLAGRCYQCREYGLVILLLLVGVVFGKGLIG